MKVWEIINQKLHFENETIEQKMFWLLSFDGIFVQYLQCKQSVIENVKNNQLTTSVIDNELKWLKLTAPQHLIINGIFFVNFSQDQIHYFLSLSPSECSKIYINSFCQSNCYSWINKTLSQSEETQIITSSQIVDILKNFYLITSECILSFQIEQKKIYHNCKNLGTKMQYAQIQGEDLQIILSDDIKIFEIASKNKKILKKSNEINPNDEKIKQILSKKQLEFKKKLEDQAKQQQQQFKMGLIHYKLFQKQQQSNQNNMMNLEFSQSEKHIQIKLNTLTLGSYDTNYKQNLNYHLKQIDIDIENLEIYFNFDHLLNVNTKFAFYNYQNEHQPFIFRCFVQCDDDWNPVLKDKQNYHQRYNLPMNEPYLHKNNNYDQYQNVTKSGKLKNVHLDIIHKGLEGGTKYLVQGNYVFHHYLQDGMDDKGWGCAYRSLQSVLSWFNEQKYVDDLPIPTHKQIQQMLVQMGDKPKEFVGTSEWIGAFEVSYIIQKLTNADCKMLHLSNGDDIMSVLQQFKDHFLNEGTPIMYGGGVYAYSLLGIDHNEKTDDVRFLILDPHYTGQDNIKSVIEKGGIQWKKSEIFLAGTFYNFCLPLRPKQI